MTTHIADGPCQVGHDNTDVPLTGETVPLADGRTLWRVASGQACRVCGQVFDWMIEAPIVLDLPMRVRVRELVEAIDD